MNRLEPIAGHKNLYAACLLYKGYRYVKISRVFLPYIHFRHCFFTISWIFVISPKRGRFPRYCIYIHTYKFCEHQFREFRAFKCKGTRPLSSFQTPTHYHPAPGYIRQKMCTLQSQGLSWSCIIVCIHSSCRIGKEWPVFTRHCALHSEFGHEPTSASTSTSRLEDMMWGSLPQGKQSKNQAVATIQGTFSKRSRSLSH